MAHKADGIAEFLAAYPPTVRDIAVCVRKAIRSAMPEAREMLDPSSRIIGYGFGSGYAELICTIIPSKSGVKLGIVRGADIPDPDGLLAGSGKRHRYVALADCAAARSPELRRLLGAAIAGWKQRSKGDG